MYKEKLPKNCPPKNAQENTDDLILFRIFKGGHLEELEFKPYSREFPDNPKLQKQCQAFGVSFFTTFERALDVCRESFEKRNKKLGNFIAEIKLKPGVGKYKITPKSGHCNVWFYDSFNILKDVELLNIREIEL
ncbi:hypothetical protein [Desulfonema magnum]|uniref:Uncharacterized protein n=1 Tax=Desulfonema magnum TaxID=45655 RepID=A0A975GSH0_9BACT|nr:hypothetical protein [Desulfonema magnum]QTA91902.1 Uncharacterized protein dnm_079755 [Desulfonema magnum]